MFEKQTTFDNSQSQRCIFTLKTSSNEREKVMTTRIVGNNIY